jgi:DNA polymerase-3 subunit alpha
MRNRLLSLFGQFDESRFETVNKDHLQYELDVVENEMDFGVEYYQKIIKEFKIDVENPNNSVILYLYSKVDRVDNDRKTNYIKEKSTLPDIDTDVPLSARGMVFNYLSSKYGKDSVAQVITFGTMKARSAIKEVLRVTDFCDNTTANKITESIPEEAKVEPQMKEVKEKSLIVWTLKYCPDILKDYVRIDENGELHGEFAEPFKKAIRLEGIVKSTGKHAAAIIIDKDDLGNTYPMVYDSHGEKQICGMEFTDLEEQGALKLDLLGLAALDKLMSVNSLLRYGKLINYDEEKIRNSY